MMAGFLVSCELTQYKTQKQSAGNVSAAARSQRRQRQRRRRQCCQVVWISHVACMYTHTHTHVRKNRLNTQIVVATWLLVLHSCVMVMSRERVSAEGSTRAPERERERESRAGKSLYSCVDSCAAATLASWRSLTRSHSVMQYVCMCVYE